MNQREFIVAPLGISMLELAHRVSALVCSAGAPVQAWYVPSETDRTRGVFTARRIANRRIRPQRIPAHAIPLGVYAAPIVPMAIVEDVYDAAGVALPDDLPDVRHESVMREEVPLWIRRGARGMQCRFSTMQKLHAYLQPLDQRMVFRSATITRYQHTVPDGCVMVGTYSKGATQAALIDDACKVYERWIEGRRTAANGSTPPCA